MASKIIVDQLQKTGGSTTALTLPTSNASAGQVLQNDGSGNLSWAADAGGLFSSYAILADQKSQNTAGGTFTTGAWRTRDLNTEVSDPDGITSISSNEFTLAAGSYLVRWFCPTFEGTGSVYQTRLYNVTDTSVDGTGMSVNAQTAGVHYGIARVSPSGSKAYRIEHQCDNTEATNGFGKPANFGTEQYTTVEIFKEA